MIYPENLLVKIVLEIDKYNKTNITMYILYVYTHTTNINITMFISMHINIHTTNINII